MRRAAVRLSVANRTRRPTCARSGQRLSPKRRSMVDRRSPTRRSALFGTCVSPSRRLALLRTCVSLNAISPSLWRFIELRLWHPAVERAPASRRCGILIAAGRARRRAPGPNRILQPDQPHRSIGLETPLPNPRPLVGEVRSPALAPWLRGQAAPNRGPVVGCFRTSSAASSASARPATIFDSAPEFGLTRRSSMPSATLPRKRS